MTTVSPAIEQRFASVQAMVSSLGPELDKAAAGGNFAGMLAAMQGAVTTLDGETPASPTSTGGSGTASSATGAGTLSMSAHLATDSSSAPTGQAVVRDALRYLGVPYQWGGTSAATGFDCSGLVQHVYADLGISLPRTSQQQATVGQAVPNLATARPGDLLFFEPGPGGPGHVGIYLGGNQMIDSPHTGTTVQIQAVTSPPCAIRRVIGPAPLPTGSSTIGGSSIGVPPTLAPLFLSAAATYGLPPQLLAAVAKVESGLDLGATSSAGAQGLMQIMPAVAQGLGIDPYDPAQAISAAAHILAGNLRQFGSIPLALAAYNAGAGAVQHYSGIPPYPQTQAYVSTIMGLIGGAS